MKFIFFVEGHVEKKILGSLLKRWLDPRLEQPVRIDCVRFQGVDAFRKKVASRANLHLRSDSSDSIIAACGLIDLHGIDFYPHELSSTSQKHDWLVKHFCEEVQHDKFRMFAAVHELEAWLLSQPDLFPTSVRHALPASVSHPEEVNLGEPPAKLLHRLFRDKLGRPYKKTTNGANFFGDLNIDVAYEKCPRLRTMLDELRNLAQTAGC